MIFDADESRNVLLILGEKSGHEERPGAPGTLLAENFLDTNLRAWDFTSGP